MADTSTRLFRASLRARLYRDVELASSGSLEDLAAAIVAVFGFYGDLTGRYHDAAERYELFADMGDADAGVKSVRRTKLSTAFPEVGKEMLFLFDHGDEWPFKVKLAGWGRNSQRVAIPASSSRSA